MPRSRGDADEHASVAGATALVSTPDHRGAVTVRAARTKATSPVAFRPRGRPRPADLVRVVAPHGCQSELVVPFPVLFTDPRTGPPEEKLVLSPQLVNSCSDFSFGQVSGQ